MASQLALQLQGLKPLTGSKTASIKSFLYDGKEASSIDNETIYNMALDGLLELASIDRRFEEFQASLLDRSKCNFHRQLSTKQENEDINKQLKKLLRMLSPYFLMTSAQRVMEFLLRRYEIHVHNVESVIECILCYHETRPFAALVKTLCLKNSRWIFLEQVQSSGEPLLRSSLSQRCVSDQSVIEFIWNMVIECGSSNSKVVNLYTATSIDILERIPQINDKLLRCILPHILYGLRQVDLPELQASSYMITAKLVAKVTLAEKVQLKILDEISNNMNTILYMDAILCIIYVLQSDAVKILPDITFENLLKVTDLVSFISDTSRTYNLSRFITLLSNKLVSGLGDNHNNVDILCDLISNINFDSMVQTIVHSLLQRANSVNYEESHNTSISVQKVLTTLYNKYPLQVDSAVENYCRESKANIPFSFISSTFNGKLKSGFSIEINGSDTSLYLSLYHPSSNIRLQAVQFIDSSLEQLPGFCDGQVLLDRLRDESKDVVCAILGGKNTSKLLMQFVEPNVLLEATELLITRYSDVVDENIEILKYIVKFFSNQFRGNHGELFDEEILKQSLIMLYSCIKASNTKISKNVITLVTELQTKTIGPLDKSILKKLPKSNEKIFDRVIAALSVKIMNNIKPNLEYFKKWSTTSSIFELVWKQVLFNIVKNLKDCDSTDKEVITKEFSDLLKANWEQLMETPTESTHDIKDLVNMMQHLITFNKSSPISLELFALMLSAPVDQFSVIQANVGEILNNSFLENPMLLLTRIFGSVSSSINVFSRTRSLQIFSAILSEKKSLKTFADIEHVLPVVYVLLADTYKSVRLAAISCFEALILINYESGKNENPIYNRYQIYKSFFSDLVSMKQEIVMDHSVIRSRSKVMYYENKKENANHFFSYLLLEGAIKYVEKESKSKVLGIFEILHDIDDWTLWEGTLDWFRGKLNDSTFIAENEIFLHMLISRYQTPSNCGSKQKVTMPIFDFVLSILSSDISERELLKLQKFSVSLLTANWYLQLDGNSRHKLSSTLIKLLTFSKAEISSIVRRSLASFPITETELDKILTTSLKSIQMNIEYSQLEATVICEVLQNKLHEEEFSGAILFRLYELLVCIIDKTSDCDYLVQVIFSCMIKATKQMKHKKGNSKVKKSENAKEFAPKLLETVLSIIQSTSSLQIRNSAYILIAEITQVYPDDVLDALLPIISASNGLSLSQEDDYSHQVIQHLISLVLPCLEKKENGEIRVFEFINTLVKAFASIHSARRLSIFTCIVNSLESSSLIIVVCQLLKQHLVSVDSGLLDCAHTLVHQFETSEQLKLLNHLLKNAYVNSLVTVKEEDSDTDHEDTDEDSSCNPNVLKLTLGECSDKMVQKIIVQATRFIPTHLSSRELHNKILDSDEDSLQFQYLGLAQSILLFIRRASIESGRYGSNKKSSKHAYWVSISDLMMEALDSLQKLLSSSGFVTLIGELINNENSGVRRKALQLLNERVVQEKDSYTPGEVMLFMDMLPDLNSIILDASESHMNCQTALLSLDLLARSFGGVNKKVFQQSLKSLVEIASTEDRHESPHVVGSIFICISSICNSIGPLAMPLLPKFFPSLLSILKATYESKKTKYMGGSTSILQQCLLSSLNNILSSMTKFLSPYIKCILLSLLHPSLLNHSEPQINILVKNSLKFLGSEIETRLLIPALYDCYDQCMVWGDSSTIEFYHIHTHCLESMNKNDVQIQLPHIAKFFVKSFDIRRVYKSFEDISTVEGSVIDSFITFVLKLSEKQLRPLFLKLSEWCTVELRDSKITIPEVGGDLFRLITFYRLVEALSSRLRSIFVPFFGNLFSPIRIILGYGCDKICSSPSKDDDDAFFLSEAPPNKKLKTSHAMELSSKDISLLYLELNTYVMKAINNCCTHDNEGFMNPSRFEMLFNPISDQLEIGNEDGESEFSKYVKDVVVPTISSFMIAGKDDKLWKRLHHSILMKSRSDNPSTRIASLMALETCYMTVGEEFLAMLPESIPFLAELMEDTNEEVESLCHQVIKKIEDLSGESLNQYLQR